ncbi:MAG: Rpn family recombination-promoting nuclease/putative transposase [bacterium]|nr:Rpn family recombination-promoting nuclease/putative transposase [bacterium]
MKDRKKQPDSVSERGAAEQAFQSQEADVSGKRIFGNHTLCAQFLRDYSELPMLAHVQPEDIEDVTERYHLFREVEFQSDTVKKVHVREQADGEAKDIYILSLIEHKSKVDYDVTMQILKYMVCIWENEAVPQTEGKKHPHKLRRNKRKDYRYPPIYPIVYYEGKGEWTAARSLKERIMLGDLFAAYIPDFTYRLVRTQDYSNEELLSREDAISLLMLLNKIQQAKDFQELSGLPTDRINDIMHRMPVDVAEIIVSAVRSLCLRLNLTSEETTDLVKKVEGGNMGYLWENMDKMDIQLERRNTAEQRQRAEEAEQEAEAQKHKASNAYRMLLSTYQKQGMSKAAAEELLRTEAGMEEKEIFELLSQYWRT